jgi:catechol 2,3-dioxygenase-like lactoylglutathione lyase family enzyme
VRLNHLHLHVRDRPTSESFYADWFGMMVVRRGENLTFLADDDGFELALMDDREPSRMPAWFHFGYGLSSAREVIGLHGRMSDSGVVILKPLYKDDELVSFRCADPDGYAIEVYWEGTR